MPQILHNDKGFTLVELLVATAIFLVLMGAIFSTFRSQQQSYLVQEQVVAMQQNLRAGMLMMEKEIRMAGYDPQSTANAGITTAAANQITFTKDDDENGALGGTGESITYSLYTTGWGTQAIGRAAPSTNQAIADNIDALDFVYLDADGNETATTSDIVRVQVSMVARTGQGDRYYVNNNVYRNQQNSIILDMSGASDNFRRRLVTMDIKCRNLALN